MVKLEKKYKDIGNVVVIDGAEIWNQLNSPSFVDSVHPDAKTSSEAAKIFFEDANAQLASFGF